LLLASGLAKALGSILQCRDILLVGGRGIDLIRVDRRIEDACAGSTVMLAKNATSMPTPAILPSSETPS
jgi:hypothetical protein